MRATRSSPAALSLVMAMVSGCGSVPPPSPTPAPPAAPPPPSACGTVDVDDHTRPIDETHARVVRDELRQKLFASGACARPFHIHGDMTLEQLGADGLRVRLRFIVYGNSGALAGEIPSTVSINHAAPGEVAPREALLRAAADQAAQVYLQSFH